jgi:hypothetical protein
MLYKELNTNPFSTERIWVRHDIATHMPDYSVPEHDTPEKIIEFLKQASEKAKKEGYVRVRVYSYCDNERSEDYDGGGYEYLKVSGMRLETDKEYNLRISGLIDQMKREKENYDKKRHDFYSSCAPGVPSKYEKRLLDLQTTLNSI